MRAVVIGPGRIGCGFAGHVLREAGYDVTFVGRPPVVAHLRQAGRYAVRLVDGANRREITVAGITALDTRQTTEVADAIAAADLVVTAVGPANLTAAARLLARGLAGAKHSVNVIACENLPDAGARVRRAVAGQIGGNPHGFSGAVVGRVVAHRLLPARPDQPLVLIGDPVCEFAVDASALATPLPPIRGLIPVEDYGAWYRRKLYRYSAGHATAAYLGHLKGHQYVHAAIRDPEIRAAVRAAMLEGQAGLRAAYGDRVAGDGSEIEAIMRRIDNAGVADTVRRVGRDPRRKLAPEDRLIGPASLALRAGVPPTALARAAAAALCFWDPEDTGAVALRGWLDRGDGPAVLHRLCGLEPGSELFCLITEAWRGFAPGWQQGNLLLCLDRPRWAWVT